MTREGQSRDVAVRRLRESVRIVLSNDGFGNSSITNSNGRLAISGDMLRRFAGE